MTKIINGITAKEAEKETGIPMTEIIGMIKRCEIFGMYSDRKWYVSPFVIPLLK